MNGLNRVLGLLVGLSLLALGAFAIVEAIVATMDRPGWLLERQGWDAVLRGLDWNDRRLMVTGGLLSVAGLVLLVVQFWPATPSRLPVAGTNPHRRAAIDGRGLQEVLRRRAAEDEDVLAATARVRRRTARVTVDAPADADGASVKARVRDALQSRVDDLGLEKPLRPRVVVRRAKERVR